MHAFGFDVLLCFDINFFYVFWWWWWWGGGGGGGERKRENYGFLESENISNQTHTFDLHTYFEVGTHRFTVRLYKKAISITEHRPYVCFLYSLEVVGKTFPRLTEGGHLLQTIWYIYQSAAMIS